MKKIITLIVLVVAYLGASYAIGYYSQSNMENQAAQISSVPGYQAEVTDFEHGLFTSGMKLSIDIDTDYLFADIPELQELIAMMGETVLIYDVSVYQGPLVFHKGFYPGLFKAEFRLSDEQEWVQELRETLGTDTLMDNVMAMNFFGKGTGYLRIEATDSETEEFELSFGGMDIEYSLEDFGQRYDTSGTVHPSSLTADGGTLSFSALTFSGQGEVSAEAFVNPGRFEINLDSVNFNDGFQTLFSMSGLQTMFEAILDDNDTTFSMNYEFSIDGIESLELSPGISNAHLNMGLLNLDKEGFSSFSEALMAASSMDDEFQAQMTMMQASSQLLTGTPSLVIRDLSYAQGPDITLDLDGHLSLIDDISANTGNPLMALAALEAELNLDFTDQFYAQMVEYYVESQLPTEGVNEQFRTQMREQQMNQHMSTVQQLLGSGYLRQEGNTYSLNASMAEGQLNVNDMPIPLPFF